MRTAIIALSAVALIVTAPAVYAQGASTKTPGQEIQMKVAKKPAPGKEKHAKRSKSVSPGVTTGSATKSKSNY